MKDDVGETALDKTADPDVENLLRGETGMKIQDMDGHDAKLAHQFAVQELVDPMQVQRIALGDAVESGHVEGR